MSPNDDMDQALEAAYLCGTDETFAKVLFLIMSQGVSPDYQHTDTQVTALMVAAGRGRVAIMEHLLSLGASLTLRSANDKTAYGWATTTKQQEAIDMLRCYAASEGIESLEINLLCLITLFFRIAPSDRVTVP